MKVSTEQNASRQAVVQIEIEPTELEQAMDRAYRRVVRQVSIPGFRPGKAPRHIVERRLGRAVLVEEAARELVPKMTGDVIEEQQLDAIGQPEVEITSLDPLAFRATISLRPTVTLGDYRAVRVMPKEINVTEEQVDEVIDRLRTGRATWSAPSEPRPAADGDRVTIDLASTVDGEPLEEPQEDVVADLDQASGQPSRLLPQLQEAIIGLNIGDQAEVTIPFDEEHSEERIRGKEVTFAITLKGIQERHLPELDEEFIQQVSDAIDLDELRGRIRANLETQARETARAEVSRAAIDLATEGATIEMPPVLVEDQIDVQLQDRQQLFARQGIQWDRVLEITNQSEEQVREEMRPEAERRIRSSLVLLEIAKAEELNVSDEEIAAEAERIVATYPPEQQPRTRQNLARAEARTALQNSLYETKIIDRLIEIATEGRGYAVAPGEGGLPSLTDSIGTGASETDTPPPATPDAGQ